MFSIAIDGPAGAGKSSMAKRLARELGFVYIDTGAMYRTAAVWAIQRGFAAKDTASITAALHEMNIDIVYAEGTQRMILNGEDVTAMLRTPEVSIAASDIAVIAEVRLKLVELQRQLAKKSNVIMDGRDIGTYVLPDADLKIFMNVSDVERARRRMEELQRSGNTSASYDQVLSDIRKRDEQDSTRAFAPLKRADDAVDFENVQSEEASYAALRELIRQKLGV